MNDEIVAVHKSKLTTLGNSVRAKTGGTEQMTLDDMATTVANIPSYPSDVLVPPTLPTLDATITIT